ncbi:MAG TPA: PhoD-like phosphatase N-terminal domain-containing protein, partial [Kaistiaceae bacterium]|nr:PhoD-like phosphatase N-terminal domain-containing protein [Kaistiaceae bacterium]
MYRSKIRGGLSRRRFLQSSAAGGLVMAGGLVLPALSRAADRPVITHGLQSGDVDGGRAMLWARADREARMMVELATRPDFAGARRLPFVDVGEATDFVGKLDVTDLPADSEIFYRVRFADLAMPGAESEPMTGRLRTAPSAKKTITFGWSGDTAGQG